MTHKVTLKPGGQSFEAEDTEAILTAAIRNGINLPHSCRSGSCLSCRARVVSGEVGYRHGLPPALTSDEAGAGWALLCQARARTDLTLEAAAMEVPDNIRIRRLPCRVLRMRRLSEDVMALFLKLPGFEPFEFLAGQYVDILLADGRRRSFSMANPPHEADVLELHVRRVEGGDFTSHVFDRMKEKALLRIEGPLGQFYWREGSDRPVIMVAGGTGYAPIKSMLRHVYRSTEERPIRFYWGAKQLEGIYDKSLADRAERQGFGFTPVLADPSPRDAWQGRIGLVHRAVLEDQPDLSGFDVYMAGPPAMIETARRDFAAAGLPPERLFFDSFDYAADSGEEPPAD